MGIQANPAKEAARRSAALQQRVMDAMSEGNIDEVPPPSVVSWNNHGEAGARNKNEDTVIEEVQNKSQEENLLGKDQRRNWVLASTWIKRRCVIFSVPLTGAS
ncbi:hypothetical protein TraAM80_07486 [Trypanosoma rangeli]|uniref:Uncharacterized protein n=1 Tax=Trypanosoma rangeli TaxID=5698 RepID=A0A3R7LNX6_TRYRA|nr:uncharacterized protein TraAM80_07486 [Trypanosoma rangeli]RNF00582.1 hypothetical protein TraAM80_07486 [Trypanosoma rangeli]|eukprot:RNF00582.1 hypothetical protein TraAM80_07486 [Trypanosoma rangeli]